MKGVSARSYSTNYFQRLNLESWYTKTDVNKYRHLCTNDLSRTKTKLTNGLLTDGSYSDQNRPMKMTNFARVFQQIPLRLNYRLTSTIRNLQRLFIHKKITPARLACLCFMLGEKYVNKIFLLFSGSESAEVSPN